MSSVLKFLGYAFAGVAVLVVGLVVWGLIEPRLLDEKPIEGEIPGLPDAWEGARVVQLSDWQIGMWLDNPGTVEQAIRAIDPSTTELVVLTGDFVYGKDDDPHEQYAFLTRMASRLKKAGVPTYAVLGNHDYRLTDKESIVDPTRAGEIRRALREGGVHILQNEAVALPSPDGADPEGHSLYLIGIGSRRANRAHPRRALAEVPDDAPRLVIMHHPDTFARFPPHTAPLALAGHTHGGQIRIPGLPQWSWIVWGKSDIVHADGFIPHYGASGNRLYVNRGIGMSKIPLRINCLPEMTRLTLRTAD